MKHQVLSIAQCEELVALGIDMSNASMSWGYHIADKNKENPLLVNRDQSPMFVKEFIPTFTVQDLIDLLPSIKGYSLGIYPEVKAVSYSTDKEPFKMLQFYNSSSLLNALYNMLKWCKENKYI